MKQDPSMLGVSEYERSERDWYPTPEDATRVVFKITGHQHSDSVVWEPACGDGAMSKVLGERFKTVVNTDIHPLMENAKQADFYTFEPDFKVDWIITNPPYGKEADKFMERILYHVRKRKCSAAILARNELDCASGREKFFGKCSYYAGKRVLLWRPRWVAGSTGSPRHNYAWYYWRHSTLPHEPQISYEKRSR